MTKLDRMPDTKLLLLTTSLLACTQPAPSVAGHWRSECLPTPQANGSTLYATLDLVGTGTDRWALDYTLHGDAACSAALVTVSIDGTYSIDEPSKVVTDAWNARFGFDDKRITPRVQQLADALTAAHCGTAAWQVGAAQSVYTAGCAAFGQYPAAQCAADYDLVAVDGNSLRFGARPADNNLCNPDKRPTALASISLTKQ